MTFPSHTKALGSIRGRFKVVAWFDEPSNLHGLAFIPRSAKARAALLVWNKELSYGKSFLTYQRRVLADVKNLLGVSYAPAIADIGSLASPLRRKVVGAPAVAGDLSLFEGEQGPTWRGRYFTKESLARDLLIDEKVLLGFMQEAVDEWGLSIEVDRVWAEFAPGVAPREMLETMSADILAAVSAITEGVGVDHPECLALKQLRHQAEQTLANAFRKTQHIIAAAKELRERPGAADELMARNLPAAPPVRKRSERLAWLGAQS